MSRMHGLQRYLEVAVGVGALLALYATSRHSYLLFHALSETFGVVVALCIFIVAWNAREFYDNSYLLLIGVASAFVGGLGLLHMLAYRGMGIFPLQIEANLATQLWISARSMESAAFLVAPLVLGRRMKPGPLLLGGALVTGLLVASIFVWHIFPTCYIEGRGLTGFKIGAEYVICLAFAIGLVLLQRNRRFFEPPVVRLLSVGMVTAIAAEIAFTQYVGVYGPVNMIGHLLRILSLYLIYKAIVQTGLVRPYGLLFRELQQREQDLRAANTMQEQTTQFLVHDMLNPLSGILGGVQSVLDHAENRLDPADQEMLEAALASGSWLVTLTRALLDCSRIESGRAPLRPKRVRSSDLVKQALTHLSPWISLQRADIYLEVPAGDPMVLADQEMSVRVLVNVLSNSLRYSPPDTVIAIRVKEDTPGEIAFSVTDQGPGVPEGWTERIFDRFVSTKAREAGVASFGLGLAFCRLAVLAQGGRISLRNEPEGGATVTFTLPAAEAVGRPTEVV